MPDLHEGLEILQRWTHKPDLARVVGAAKLALRIALQHIHHGLEVDELGRLVRFVTGCSVSHHGSGATPARVTRSTASSVPPGPLLGDAPRLGNPGVLHWVGTPVSMATPPV